MPARLPAQAGSCSLVLASSTVPGTGSGRRHKGVVRRPRRLLEAVRAVEAGRLEGNGVSDMPLPRRI